MKKYFVILAFAFLLDNCFSATLGEIRDDIRVSVNDASTISTNRKYSDTILNFRINEIQKNICEQTRCLITRLSTPTVAYQREYTYPSNMISPIRLAYVISNSTSPAYKALTRYSIAGLDTETLTWESSLAGLPTKYYERGQKYGLQPMPSSVYASTYAVQIDYYSRATNMSSDSDIPFDGDVLLYDYHKLLILGVTIWCRQDKGLSVIDMKQEYYALLQNMFNAIRERSDKKESVVIPFR